VGPLFDLGPVRVIVIVGTGVKVTLGIPVGDSALATHPVKVNMTPKAKKMPLNIFKDIGNLDFIGYIIYNHLLAN
jgi:hypothetical protein